MQRVSVFDIIPPLPVPVTKTSAEPTSGKRLTTRPLLAESQPRFDRMHEGERMRNIEPAAGEPPNVVKATSERIACRIVALDDLMRDTGRPAADAFAKLWTLSRCRACGQCADMAAR